MPDQPNTVEPVPVQLTRIEGTVNLIAYQMTELKAEVSGVKGDLSHLANRVASIELQQASASGSAGFVKAWLPVVVSLMALGAALGFGIKFG